MLPFLVGLGILIGGAIIVACWDDIVNWLKDLIPKIAAAFRSAARKIAHAAAMFVQWAENKLAAIRHKLYYKEQGEWIEETTTRKVDPSEVPLAIRRKIRAEETEATEEFERELQMEI